MARNREIWIFGGAGYIGSHIAQALVDTQEPVNILDRNPLSERQRRYGLGDIRSVTAEIEDQILRRHVAVDPLSQLVVIHAAGPSSVSESYQDPLRYFRDHLGSTIELANFLSWLSKNKPNISTSVIYASSCTVYDQSESAPFTEDTPLKATSPYAQSKLASENLLKHFANSTETPVICFRFFNAAGADPRGHLGEFHNPETHLIPLLLSPKIDAGNPFKVYGSDYPTHDGTCIRDYVHVCDIANAHRFAIELLTPNEQGDKSQYSEAKTLYRAFNLGAGIGYSVMDVIREARRTSRREIPAEFHERREGDAPQSTANATRAKGELGWTATKSDLTTILTDSLNALST